MPQFESHAELDKYLLATSDHKEESSSDTLTASSEQENPVIDSLHGDTPEAQRRRESLRVAQMGDELDQAGFNPSAEMSRLGMIRANLASIGEEGAAREISTILQNVDARYGNKLHDSLENGLEISDAETAENAQILARLQELVQKHQETLDAHEAAARDSAIQDALKDVMSVASSRTPATRVQEPQSVENVLTGVQTDEEMRPTAKKKGWFARRKAAKQAENRVALGRQYDGALAAMSDILFDTDGKDERDALSAQIDSFKTARDNLYEGDTSVDKAKIKAVAESRTRFEGRRLAQRVANGEPLSKNEQKALRSYQKSRK